jgi:transposase
MNSDSFIKWLREKLTPNLPPRSVLVLDNASYLSVQIWPAPTSNSTKKQMQDWLNDRNIPFSATMFKAELFEIVKLNMPKFKTYKFDFILEEHGHCVLRLPPYHPELNPIELIWGLVKNCAATHNVSFRLDEVENLLRQKFNSVTPDEWASRCLHAKSFEDRYLEDEGRLDDFEDRQFLINLEISSSGDDKSGSDERQETDSDISGIGRLQSDSE